MWSARCPRCAAPSTKAIAYIVAVNLEQCIVEEQQKGGDSGKLVQEAVELLVKSR